jgi:hypothetical protein
MVKRVLTLCGYVQNASILRKRMGALRKTCKDVEFGAHLRLLSLLNRALSDAPPFVCLL